MATDGVSINWGGLDDFLKTGEVNIGNTKKLMTTIGQAMLGQTVRRFAKGNGPDGEPWKKSARAEKTGKGKTLLDTGHLRKSISFSATPLDVVVGSNVPYAAIHQLGGKAGKGLKVELPARPYLGISAEDSEEIKALVADHIERSFIS